ncbi:histidine kinase-like ATPase domain-containing protein [Aspergillus mulundensis]|uniref:Sacsin/Nov domain-containing protein n=1 Tax=Aspergillus mulundensis TaxID=1810919 RepID=A0A3D8SC65_9EURO|nr:hypothetical protein DSM5745_04263 [Aspergillus mulundensis]RDW83937.1 hypothetical protein DSM5745_04263 [Aspergillus mulundensis]
MAQNVDFTALKARTMRSGADEEAVTVDTRGLISKVLARYSGQWTVLREMIQNAADANATKVTIKFETLPSTTVPLPSAADSATMIKHTISHHTLKRLLITNNGTPFSEKDWARLKRIADGNPDETKIGAFGVGFYSVFDEFDEPFVCSGTDGMAFYWKGNALYTRQVQLNEKATSETTFVLEYRNDTSPVPSLVQLCQFLCSSLTFVNLQCIELWLDDCNILRLVKKIAPGVTLAVPKDLETKTQEGLLTITSVTREVAQVDAAWMRVLEWNPNANTLVEGIRDTTVSLRSFLSRLTQSSSGKPLDSQKKEVAGDIGDLTKISTASVFLHINTASIQTSISQSLSSELERATLKPPPKKTTIAVLTDTSLTSASSEPEFISSILPSKGGRVFIGFPTQQTTGLNAHISAPSVIPTVERESIDLNTRYIRKWNTEMLRAAGIVCRIAWSAEMASVKSRIITAKEPSKQSKIRKDDIVNVLPEAIHTANQFVFRESTPSSLLGQTVEDAFWTSNKNASIELLSSCGVVHSHQARLASKDLTFLDSIPVLPDEFVEGSKEFVKKLTLLGLLTEVTVTDIKRELESSSLQSSQITEFLAWLGRRAVSGQLDIYSVRSILNVAVASADDESGKNTGLVIFSAVSLFLNPQRIPAELPLPPAVMPFKYTKALSKKELELFGWEELHIVPWLCWLISNVETGKRLTQEPVFAAQVLPVISKHWESLSQSSKQDVVDQLQAHKVIPTRVGMKRPSEAYFPSVRLFDDLPVVHGLQGVKEKFLSALGVRKTVELGVIFERLLNTPGESDEKSPGQGKWSHVDLIRYLASVSNDIPASDIKRLKDTSFCTAEPIIDHNGARTPNQSHYKVQQLYEPNDALRALGLPVLEWPGKYISSSAEGKFLARLGLQTSPKLTTLTQIMASAAQRNDWALHGKAMSYFVTEFESNGYGAFDCGSTADEFLPTENENHAGAEINHKASAPSKCYTDEGAALFGFDILRKDLHRHASKLGVQQHPKLSYCLDILIRRPPSTKRDARSLYKYLAGRVSELTTRDIDRVGKAEIVPVHIDDSKGSTTRRVAPRLCYLGDGEDYKDIFDFVDFGQDANLFLMAVGSKSEPTKVELAQMVVREPARISSTLQSAEKYLRLLRTLAEDMSSLRKHKDLMQEMRKSAFLLASKDIPSTVQVGKDAKKTVDNSDDEDEAEEEGIREWTLAAARDTIVVDDFQSFVLFKDHVFSSPQEEILEKFYLALGAVPLSQLVEERANWGAVVPDQIAGLKLLKLIRERSRLFLHDQPLDGIRHDSRWIDKNLKVQVVQSIVLTKTLKGRNVSYRQERKAIVTEVNREFVMRICPQKTYDFYEISQALSHLILTRPKLHSALTLEMLLKTDLLELKERGYNVERILKKKAQEALIAESRRQQQLEEERRRLQDKETAIIEEAQNQTAEKQGPTSMPGVFPDSPSSKDVRPVSPTEPKEKRNLFSSFTKHFSQGNRSSWNPFGETAPLPDTPKDHAPQPPIEQPKPKQPRHEAPVTVNSTLQTQRSLLQAVQSSRPHGSSGVFSRPQVDQINELKSYCDEKPGHDLEFAATLPCGVNILLARTVERSAFLANNSRGMNLFGSILLDCADVFSLRPDTVSIFYDPGSKAIGFNRAGSIFCNYHYFQQLHEKALLQKANPDRAEAIVYWWVVLAHELSHNLVSDHSSAHSYYTESFVSQYFPRVAAKIASATTTSPSPEQ